jgi:hypothetical protein
MAKTIIFIFAAFLSMARLADAICCESIKSEVDKKIEANKTLCAPRNTLPLNCCKDIANEVEKHVAAYETLCNKGKIEANLICTIYIYLLYKAKTLIVACLIKQNNLILLFCKIFASSISSLQEIIHQFNEFF